MTWPRASCISYASLPKNVHQKIVNSRHRKNNEIMNFTYTSRVRTCGILYIVSVLNQNCRHLEPVLDTSLDGGRIVPLPPRSFIRLNNMYVENYDSKIAQRSKTNVKSFSSIKAWLTTRDDNCGNLRHNDRDRIMYNRLDFHAWNLLWIRPIKRRKTD